jgi:hypothetical protein
MPKHGQRSGGSGLDKCARAWVIQLGERVALFGVLSASLPTSHSLGEGRCVAWLALAPPTADTKPVRNAAHGGGLTRAWDEGGTQWYPRRHPAPRSLHSQKCVNARARDASVKAQGKGLASWEDLRQGETIACNMFPCVVTAGLSELNRTLRRRRQRTQRPACA